MSSRRTILLLIPHLGGGGAERVIALLASSFNPEKFEVHLGLITQRNADRFSIPSWVTVHGMGARRVRSSVWGLLRLVWRVRPDVILSGMAHLNLLLLMLRPLFPRATKLLVRQNECVVAGDSSQALRRLYPKADAVVCQTAAMATELSRIAGSDRNLRVLPNPIDVEMIRAICRSTESRWTGPGPHLLAIGRLSPEKGLDLLIEAFAAVCRQFPCADLIILGRGREKPTLDKLVWRLGLQPQVRLAGHVDQPAQWFPGTSLFVLSSRNEALPNALLEAAAAGLPIVATPASDGLVDLLRGQPGVWLAADASVEAIAAAISSALRELQPSHRFAHPWVDAFRKERAVAAYECLFNELAERVP